MKSQDENNAADRQLATEARREFESAVDSIDAGTGNRLRLMRREALAGTQASGRGWLVPSIAAAAAVLAAVSVSTLLVVAPSTAFGANVAVTPLGRFSAVRFTAPVNPPPRVSVTGTVVVPPTTTAEAVCPSDTPRMPAGLTISSSEHAAVRTAAERRNGNHAFIASSRLNRLRCMPHEYARPCAMSAKQVPVRSVMPL